MKKERYVYYWKVREAYAGIKVGFNLYETVANELLTDYMFEKLKLPLRAVERVKVPESSVYWLFGARFSTIFDD